MALPQKDHDTEEPSFTKRLTDWAKDKKPDITAVVGIREYKKNDIEKTLREDVDRRIGAVHRSHEFP